MQTGFDGAAWIWCRTGGGSDVYCEFYDTFTLAGCADVTVFIAADTAYALYLNGVYAESGRFSDWPHKRTFDTIDISAHVRAGVNTLALCVWHVGASDFSCCPDRPGVIFAVRQGGAAVCSSGAQTKSRLSRRCVSGRCRPVTPQLGFGFALDLRGAAPWEPGGWTHSIVQPERPAPRFPRETERLRMLARTPWRLLQQGTFSDPASFETDGARMQRAALSFLPLAELAQPCADGYDLRSSSGGIYVVVDLQKETAGFLELDLEVREACTAELGWGEHLTDGRCRTQIGARDFSAALYLREGRNRWMHPLRRLGCRYLQLFVHAPQVKLRYLGLRPTVYPLNRLPFSSGSLLRDTIYSVCADTLELCMHEHYEDCPWREQALYTTDSRNQMLCGYYAFGETRFPRACLRLIAAGIRPDGMLPITAPTADTLTIPFFTLMFLTQVLEYHRHADDPDTVRACMGAMQAIADAFCGRIDGTGLIPDPQGADIWNFYEWQPYLDGQTCHGAGWNLCLNAEASIALASLSELKQALGMDGRADAAAAERLAARITERFFDGQSGLFRLFLGHDEERTSVLGNALAVLCGAADRLDTARIEAVLLANGEGAEGPEAIAATLSMACFRYDALLRLDRTRYREAILQDIDRTGLSMLRSGATSFWETIRGAEDFDGAGSLCHGWSAMPVYYYRTLLEV